MTIVNPIELCEKLIEEYPDAEFGPAHIVVSDYNFYDEDIHYCLRYTIASLDKSMIHTHDEDMIKYINLWAKHSRLELIDTEKLLRDLLKIDEHTRIVNSGINDLAQDNQ